MSPIEGDEAPAGPVLALETATALGSVALARDGRLLAEVTLGVEVRHSESLLPAIRFTLERTRIEPRDLAAIVVGAGPGSFTGVRIAGATAKGMVHALGVPLYAYSTLAALAAGAGITGRPICAILTARSDEVFGACYRFPVRGGIETLLAPSLLRAPEIADRLSAIAPLWVGNGAVRFEALLSAHGEVAGEPLSVPRASALPWLTARAPSEGRVADPSRWAPEYGRPPGVTVPG